jgi:tRNA pseudouridine55 synthase
MASAAMTPETALHQGSLLKLDKPSGPTSHDIVHAVRRHLGARRVGHAGTLDPQATGLLVLGVGPATRLLSFISGQDKLYRGTMALGQRTDTLDAAGQVTQEKPWPRDAALIRRVGESFIGELRQRPPMVSAVKIGGQRLYRLARRGVEIERPERHLLIRNLDILDIDLELGRVEFEVECSSGTYVRSIADSWAEKLESVGHLQALRRLAVGKISVEGAFPAERLARRGEHPAGQGEKRGGSPPGDWRDLESARISWEDALFHLDVRTLEGREKRDLSFGRAPRSNGEEGLLRLQDDDGTLLGIAEGSPAGLPLKLRCVLISRDSIA